MTLSLHPCRMAPSRGISAEMGPLVLLAMVILHFLDLEAAVSDLRGAQQGRM